LGPARSEGYFPRGIRKNFFADKTGAERAVLMMLARLRGEPFQTEYEMPVFKHIPPARPLKDLASASIALVTSGGIVPRGNPAGLRVSSAESFHAYDISTLDALSADSFESVHGGYDRQWANENPNVVLPVDGMRELEKQGVFGRMHPLVYTTTGTGTSVQLAESFGQAIGEELRKAEVSAAILTST
jgi:glycine reductase